MIDRFVRTMTICSCDRPDMVVPEKGVYQTPLLPGFELPRFRLLEVADRWRDSKATSLGCAVSGGFYSKTTSGRHDFLAFW
jgi:hypothetical protein